MNIDHVLDSNYQTGFVQEVFFLHLDNNKGNNKRAVFFIYPVAAVHVVAATALQRKVTTLGRIDPHVAVQVAVHS